jgi:hypothetical protein
VDELQLEFALQLLDTSDNGFEKCFNNGEGCTFLVDPFPKKQAHAPVESFDGVDTGQDIKAHVRVLE